MEERWDLVFIRLELVVSAPDGGTFGGGVFEFDDGEGDAIDEDDNIGAAVVLAIDDVSAMGAEALDALGDVIANSAKSGVTVIATAGSWLEVPSQVRSGLRQRLELRLKVPRHSVIDPAAAEAVPSVPGQGLVAGGHRMQIAVPNLDPAGDADDLEGAVTDLVAQATAAWADGSLHPAKPKPASS